MRSALAMGLVLGALTVLPACAAQPPATATPLAATETEVGPLQAGRYTYGGFSPRISVDVPAGEWETFHRDPEFWDVARRTEDGVVALMFLHPPNIIGADGPVPATTADAALRTLRGNPNLHVIEERQVEIDGRAATQLTITVDEDNTHMLGSEGALLGIGPDDAVRLAFFDAGEGDGVLVIGTVAQRSALGEADALLQPLIETVTIGE